MLRGGKGRDGAVLKAAFMRIDTVTIFTCFGIQDVRILFFRPENPTEVYHHAMSRGSCECGILTFLEHRLDQNVFIGLVFFRVLDFACIELWEWSRSLILHVVLYRMWLTEPFLSTSRVLMLKSFVTESCV